MTLPDPTYTNELDPLQCQQLLASEVPPLLIDCRELNEFAFCRIDGSALVPLSNFTEKAEAEFPEKDTPAIIYCHHGVRSLNAVFYLRAQGFTHTYSMRGGIDLWSLEIDPSIPRY
ncbi:rhodanese-like domain-containing protein [Rubritalea spongiae]|uniref:Rhodanese-like domain-containing protein n=1 Tax=Rubritalea spongiae TaxID=430797 RepID=A0ABW5E4A4_9BACT